MLQAAGCVLQDEGVAAKEKKMESAGQMKPSVNTQVVIRKYIIVGFRGWKRSEIDTPIRHERCYHPRHVFFASVSVGSDPAIRRFSAATNERSHVGSGQHLCRVNLGGAEEYLRS